jgi:hypothetical protein
LFSEEKQSGTKTVVGLNFRIRRNIQTAGTLKEIELEGAERAQMELGLEKVVLSPKDRAQIDKISAEFALSAKQADALVDYVARDGIGYVLEKAEIVRSKPRGNAAGAFVVALRDDWKKPASIGVGEGKAKKPKKEHPSGWREFLLAKYPGASLPEIFWNLPESIQKECWDSCGEVAA